MSCNPSHDVRQMPVFAPIFEVCLLADLSSNPLPERSPFHAPIIIFLDRTSSSGHTASHSVTIS